MRIPVAADSVVVRSSAVVRNRAADLVTDRRTVALESSIRRGKALLVHWGRSPEAGHIPEAGRSPEAGRNRTSSDQDRHTN